ncbi:hypothetical protein WK92_01845 [Burkholderia ubonensis]|nr:hypothetical protein WK82_17155 [Burkholderia ubonensis]KVW31395.1 hypothetical protein WK92_01845 [Burkholderia ubonensis]
MGAVALGAQQTVSGDGAIAIGDPNTATGDGAVSLGNNNTANGIGAVAIGSGNKATGSGAVAMGSMSNASGPGSVAIGLGAIAAGAGDIALGIGSTTSSPTQVSDPMIGGVTYAVAAKHPASTFSIGAPGRERQITNVAAGRLTASSTDAVNGSQLYALVQSVGSLSTSLNAVDKNAASASTSNSTSVASLSTLVSDSRAHYYSVSDGGSHDRNYAGDGATGTDAIAIGPSATATAAAAIGIGKGASATAAGGTAIGTNANASAGSATAIGGRAVVLAANSVALGADAIASEPNTVSIGAPGEERRITNVAAGVNSTDAVNLSQLDALHGDLNQVARKAYAGVAAVTALAMIPDVDPGKSIAIGLGAGSYQGYGATALGFSARLTSNLKLKAGIGGSSAGYSMGGGISYQW